MLILEKVNENAKLGLQAYYSLLPQLPALKILDGFVLILVLSLYDEIHQDNLISNISSFESVP
jgi:hypothetical protein